MHGTTGDILHLAATRSKHRSRFASSRPCLRRLPATPPLVPAPLTNKILALRLSRALEFRARRRELRGLAGRTSSSMFWPWSLHKHLRHLLTKACGQLDPTAESLFFPLAADKAREVRHRSFAASSCRARLACRLRRAASCRASGREACSKQSVFADGLPGSFNERNLSRLH